MPTAVDQVSQVDVTEIKKTFSSLTLEKALDGMTLDIHPGALKYYKEVGLVK